MMFDLGREDVMSQSKLDKKDREKSVYKLRKKMWAEFTGVPFYKTEETIITNSDTERNTQITYGARD